MSGGWLDLGLRYWFCGLAQDSENGYYQELIAFVLFLKWQTKAAFKFSSSAGQDKQCVVGRGLLSPTLR